MLAVGRGNIVASRLIRRAGEGDGVYLYAPTCALVEADRTRRGVAEHIASLRAISLVDLDLAAALAVARDRTWAAAHVRHVAAPTPLRVGTVAIATSVPSDWSGEDIEIIDLAA
ncbi:hypothetical protein [Frankia canadensis]